MMRSLYSGVSGLKTHQIKMDVIGNNIANVNTVAFKSQSITFSELMYQTTQKASGPNAATGRAGINAKQIGLGVSSAAISTQIATQGSSQNTGNAFDLRISGDAFFVVNGGAGNKFTRDGSFYVDAVGNLAMSSNGYNVMGWQVNEDGDIVQDNVSKLQILSEENMTSEPSATTLATMEGIVDKNDPQVLSKDGKVVNLSFYDKLGYAYTARMRVNSTDEEGVYVFRLEDVLTSPGNESIKDKYLPTMFTGNDPLGTKVYAKKDATYSVLDGYTLDAATGKITIAAPGKQIKDGDGNIIQDGGNDYWTEIEPSDFISGETVNNQYVADAYANAFGFDSWDEMANLTVQQYSASNPDGEPVTVAKLLGGTTPGAYQDITNTAASIFSGQSLGVTGYATDAGTAVKVTYDQTTGAITGINGSTQIKDFNIAIQPIGDDGNVDNSLDNPFEQIKVNLEMTSNVNNEKKSTIGATSGDREGYGTGWAVGTMTGVSIQNNGMIYGAYDNGQTKLLGQIAFATFANAAGLEKEGDNLYSATLNSGEFDGVGVDVTAQGGSVSSGILEMSNVDLSTEFTELITTQRGFQANSRIITVSDTLLEELVNLKR
ncbi:MAG: flagellar hook-basal body complex protein [Lachnospiraceae bacterium]|nr:flagellar hook-basal body complex protein [Lachnospiraceae bacterium]